MSSKKENLKRFVKEARSAARVDHENVVAVIDSGSDDKTGLAYMVMEYLDGVSLGKLLDESVSLDAERALDIFIQICAGLARAHSCGVVHRDIKPSNIILLNKDNKRDFVKII
mgnify:CR=1 FL=1